MPFAVAGIERCLLKSAGVDVGRAFERGRERGCLDLLDPSPVRGVEAGVADGVRWAERETLFGCCCDVGPPLGAEGSGFFWEGSQLAGNTGRRLRRKTNRVTNVTQR